MVFRFRASCSADAYVRRLNEQGYASRTSNIYLESVAHFAHWSAQRHIGLAGINEAAVERFLKHLPLCRCAHRCQRTRPSVRAALGFLLDLLRSEGRIAEKTSPYPAVIAEEINRFEHYLKQVCGLRPATCTVRLQRVRAFLVDRFAHADIRISTVKPADVIRFMRKYTEGWTASSKRAAGDSLRSYFRFKAAQGHHTATLSAAIPNVAQGRWARLPKAISADRIARLLKAFDRSSAIGKRDYAITRCFIDLGLRTIEVARLRLDDFDWRQGLVRISGLLIYQSRSKPSSNQAIMRQHVLLVEPSGTTACAWCWSDQSHPIITTALRDSVRPCPAHRRINGQVKRPFSNLLAQTQSPLPSQTRTFSRLRWALQNNKRCPLSGSHDNRSRTRPYSPSNPLRMSVTPAAR